MGEVKGSIPFRAYHASLRTAAPYRPRPRAGVGFALATECGGGIMQVTRIGDFEVRRITEYEGPFIGPADFFPDFDAEVLRANPDMTGPRLIDPATGKLVFSFHSFVVKTGHHTILIDSCLGNDKERPTDRNSTGCAPPISPIWPPPGFGPNRSTMSCARICTGTMSAGTHGSKTGIGSRPFPMRAT
jgi:hypothetical protein